MNSLAVDRETLDRAPGLEGLLDALCKFGRPSMFQSSYSNKWVCKVEVRVNAEGANFDVTGKGPTPTHAVTQCLGRTIDAVEKMS